MERLYSAYGVLTVPAMEAAHQALRRWTGRCEEGDVIDFWDRRTPPRLVAIPIEIALTSLLLPVLIGCEDYRQPPEPGEVRGGYVVDAGGRTLTVLETGSTLHVGANQLEPNRLYEFRLGINADGAPSRANAVSFARIGSDGAGAIRPITLWYHSGVIGCSARSEAEFDLPFAFRTFDEAEEALRGARMTVSVHPVTDAAADTGAAADPLALTVEEPVSVIDLPIASRESPMVYPSNQEGCLVNSLRLREDDLWVTGRNFRPGEEVEIALVPNQREWRVGDRVADVTGERVSATADDEGRFTVPLWERELQLRGAYDIAVLRNVDLREDLLSLTARDIVSYAHDTALLLYLQYPPGGPTMDLAGRPIGGSPYFQFSDAFAEDGDTVWGAVDPTYVPAGHTGGKYAAYYVVQHRDVDGWDPGAGGATNLVDVSGGIEIMPVKSGCINATDIPIWNGPLPVGEYDVVVDFGSVAAASAAAYTTDGQLDLPLDFLDGADQIGFVVAEDPYELGSIPIGRVAYSQDDFFATLGTATDVDLRAEVRYPATAGGTDTPVDAGQHPLFLIQHGNHASCNVQQDGTDTYDALQDYLDGVISLSEFNAGVECHATCPDRKQNHRGYDNLLDVLASHGVIAVSIDAYDLTGFGTCGVAGWIEERGDLILKHIELWSHLDSPATFNTYPNFFPGKFNNHVDLTRISVSGHSRGGEAAVAAFMRDTLFGIGSVSSIAPVDFEGYVLPDVPYFVILPAADNDVIDLDGLRIWDRAGTALPAPEATTRSGIYLYGANHAFFNTVWADDRDESDPARDDYIPKAQQQRVGEAYLSAFSRSALNDEAVYEDMLRGRLIFPSTAGFKNYHFRHESDHSRIESGAGTGGVAVGMSKSSVTLSIPHETDALELQWNAGGTLEYTVPPAQRNVSSFEVLSFRVAQKDSPLNPVSGTQDVLVELVGGGNTKGVFAARFDPIPVRYDHPTYGSYEHEVMTTVRIPLHSFIMNNSGVTLGNIDTIRFRFLNPSQGEFNVDDIEFSR